MPMPLSRRKLISDGFSLVERDDRLLDVFPRESAEKGVELWEKWTPTEIKIVRIHNEKQSHRTFLRHTVETALSENRKLDL
ncbi:MAG: hypothetical protein HYR90_00455 [Candidatus Andersenbacteria bacterium]|nr:hypothetical protein [Candidatus Andersenbacteria bacterium]MBI3250704.1 hypothetical protein [Candidatus Andersenbacteria bacterium]